ncbi:hypothetical protein GUJ93_ZPchr0013g36271 [Zizania palustris]|uniref:Uncharacterized protein n=1 Tax=Zizania palustris TaxID=103762 RepID=A0A8J5WYG0_ZIZPA|nr:hypothetical protein GUJ93_ZPchr0013g36271 [Zizania palustris]
MQTAEQANISDFRLLVVVSHFQAKIKAVALFSVSVFIFKQCFKQNYKRDGGVPGSRQHGRWSSVPAARTMERASAGCGRWSDVSGSRWHERWSGVSGSRWRERRSNVLIRGLVESVQQGVKAAVIVRSRGESFFRSEKSRAVRPRSRI